MKKVIVSLLGATVLIGGAATYTFAHSNNDNFNNNERFNYEEMRPYIQEMHPNWSSQEQREMFELCH
ncbi:hypothetical protein [Paraliobacillus salinarum]|uniref:hypothetical protein n=1 Tax=Paraliobacillus salinarum TaxID=1158996 RepID=UPI0015F42FE1|nr:hypothetical protein [Paraliobacillus salinarum]